MLTIYLYQYIIKEDSEQTWTNPEVKLDLIMAILNQSTSKIGHRWSRYSLFLPMVSLIGPKYMETHISNVVCTAMGQLWTSYNNQGQNGQYKHAASHLAALQLWSWISGALYMTLPIPLWNQMKESLSLTDRFESLCKVQYDDQRFFALFLL